MIRIEFGVLRARLNLANSATFRQLSDGKSSSTHRDCENIVAGTVVYAVRIRKHSSFWGYGTRSVPTTLISSQPLRVASAQPLAIPWISLAVKTHLVNRWDAIRNSFWFVPAVMCVGAMLLALMCTSLDGPLEAWFLEFAPWVAVTTSAARSSLSSIGSAMVSIAGIVFSVMLVTLSITSSQYGSRLLRTFMSDRVTQFALGMLVGTSLFTMLSLAGIRESPTGTSTANVSVIVGLLLATTSLAVLIGFIHHVASLIQAPNVVAAVAQDLDDSFNRLFPEKLGDGSELKTPDQIAPLPGGNGSAVRSKKEGYLQAIDTAALMSVAESHDLFMRLWVKPGEFVEQNQTIVEVWPCEVFVDGHHATQRDTVPDFGTGFQDRINDTMITGRRRTPRQDAECALEELVEVAVRALSPGINDPFTAIACIDRLAAAIGRVSERTMPDPLRCDPNGVPRVLARATKFSHLMDTAFNQIRQNGGHCVAVAIRLLQAFNRIAKHGSTNEQRQSIGRHAEMLRNEFRAHVEQAEDSDDFERRYSELLELLKVPPDDSTLRE